MQLIFAAKAQYSLTDTARMCIIIGMLCELAQRCKELKLVPLWEGVTRAVNLLCKSELGHDALR